MTLAARHPGSRGVFLPRVTPETVLRSLPCACGGMVKANPVRPARGVQAHNFTSRHKAWRAAREG